MAARRLVVAAVLVLCGCQAPSPPTAERVIIAGETFDLELAVDEKSRVRGMMAREAFPDQGGMLFVFPDATERSFWMANCLINIDLLFLDARGTITAVHRMVIEPPRADGESLFAYEGRLLRYWSNGPAQFAVELEPGSLDRLGVGVNDRIDLDLRRLKDMAR